MKAIAVVLGSMSAAFLLGIETAGDVQPVIGSTEALESESAIAGDLNANGQIDLEDAIAALEIAEGYRTPAPEELAADPDQDFHITARDALSILQVLRNAPKL